MVPVNEYPTDPGGTLGEPSDDAFAAAMIMHGATVQRDEAREIAHEFYGLDICADALTGERDENFRLTSPDGRQFVLKISNAQEDPLVSDLPTAALLHIEETAPDFPCPRVCRDLEGRSSLHLPDAAGRLRTVRMLTYLPGQLLQQAPRSPAQRAECGRVSARLGQALRGFAHPAASRPLLWDLQHMGQLRTVVNEICERMPAFPMAGFATEFLPQLEAATGPSLASLRRQVVHYDMTIRNTIVDPSNPARVLGVIDFGDIVKTALIADVAVTANSQITSLASLEDDIMDMVSAYHRVEPLLRAELDVLNWLIAARMAMGVLIPIWHRIRNPSSDHFIAKNEDEIHERREMMKVLMRTRLSL